MGLGRHLKAAVREAKAAAVVAKASHDLSKVGYDPSDYAGFNNEGRKSDEPKETKK